MTDNLVKKAAHGVGWNIFSQGAQQAIKFIVIIILTRLLSPEDFGIFAIVLVFTEFIRPFREWGFQAAIIQKENIDSEYQNTAFWSICGLALTLYTLSLISAHFVGWFFRSALVTQIIPVIALIFLMTPFGAVQWALLSRTLNFKVIALRDIAATLCYGVAVCILAFKGLGIWSFVWATIIRELAYSVMFWFSYDWRPAFKFNRDKFRDLWKFSFSCTGTGILNYGINNFDNLMVGKFLGAVSLGFYNLAFNTISQPQTRIISQITNVIFPVYSIIKDDLERIREAYLKTVKTVMIITIPLISILFVAAHDFVLVFYGSKWLPAVMPIRIMCFYGLIRALTSIASPVFLSKGRPDIEFKLTIFKLCVFILCIFFGIPYGIVGVSIAVLFYALFSFFPIFYLSDRLLGIKQGKFYAIIFKYAICSFIIIGFLWTMNSFLPWTAAVSPFLRLGWNITLGLFIYLILVVVFLRQDFDAFVRLTKKVFL